MVGLLACALGCAGGQSTTATASGSMTVTTTPSSVSADGVSTIPVHVDGAAKGPIYLITTRGTFDDGTTYGTFAATPFDAVVHSCNASLDASCAGSAVIRAVDNSLASASTTVVFTGGGGSGSDGGSAADGGSGSDGGSATDGGSGSDGGTGPGGTNQLGAIELAAQQYGAQGVRFSGYQEVNVLTFQVLDANGLPYAPGLTVSFSHPSLAGSFIGTVASCSQASQPLCTASGVTDAKGQVYVPLTAGTRAGVVAVSATATASGKTVSYTTGNLAIVGAKASGGGVTVECSPRNVPALVGDGACLTAFYAPNVTCTARFADRFGNVVGVPVLATFASEAGGVGPPVLTAAYDSTSDKDQTAALGFAVDTIATSGYRLPVDVAPLPGEPSLLIANDLCGALGAGTPRTRNPRDGLVTVIVTARGEEGFVDLNGNGVYDPGEPFIDLGEPFIDANDNGIHDPGEEFIDLNGNGVYDGPNGKWDADTTIWAEIRVVYTGLPSFRSPGPGLEPAVSYTAPASLNIPANGSSSFAFKFRDENLNEPAPTFTDYALLSESSLTTPSFIHKPDTVDNLGMVFAQQYCDAPPGQVPGKCSNVCPSAPCYVVPWVGGFSAGSVGNALVKAGQNTGSDVIDITAKVNQIEVFGLVEPITVQ